MTKAYEMYKQIDIPQGVSLLPCPCCGMDAKLWRYSKSETDPSTPVVMCENGDKLGPQDGHASSCPSQRSRCQTLEPTGCTPLSRKLCTGALALTAALKALKNERDLYVIHDDDGAPEYLIDAIAQIEALKGAKS